jgi:hypothetical protein
MTMTKEAAAVVRSYFDRMRDRDLSVVDLFHEDASLVGLGGVKTGKAAIREFYEGSIQRASPSPTLVGELPVSGPRVAAEINISLSVGASIHAVDLFVVEDGLIRSLTYFIADH